MRMSLIVAYAKNRVIGRNNRLPWKLRSDLEHFKNLTLNKPIIMGRKTFESIGKPLDQRYNIVLTRDSDFQHQSVCVVHSFEQALEIASKTAREMDADEMFIIGGAEVFEWAIENVDRMYLTEIARDYEGDVQFPIVDLRDWRISSESYEERDEDDDSLWFKFVTMDRVNLPSEASHLKSWPRPDSCQALEAD